MEHFKVSTRKGGYSSHGVEFRASCLSINNIILNGKLMSPKDDERVLQHGDVIALACSVENDGSATRKTFIVFQFEILGVPAPTTAVVPVLQAPVEEEKPPPPPPPKPLTPEELAVLRQPPAGSVAGRWRSSDAGPAAPPDALFCLEIHGDRVEPLPSEARQLFLCWDPHGSQQVPTLRVGRHYQHSFWHRVLSPHLHGADSGACNMALEKDHFEILSIRRTNPQTNEPPSWRYRLRVLSPQGLTLNYSTMLTAGDERDLQQSDTITVELPLREEVPPHRWGAEPPGLHFTFIPLAGALSYVASSEVRRQLPELAWDDEPLPALSRRPRSIPSIAELNRAAPLLPPSVALDSSDRDESPIPDEGMTWPPGALVPNHSASSSLQPPLLSEHTQPCGVPTAAVLLPDEEDDPDDLFSRTGFRT